MPTTTQDDRIRAREMVDRQLRARGVRDPRLLQAMEHIPRHRFVPESHRRRAYDDCALPTRDGQTISQPYMVAFMTELLDVREGDRILEIGTGSGYQTALLATLGASVVSIECNRHLSESARAMLAELDLLDRVELHVGDGTLGYPDGAPYDGIIVTAAAPKLPPPYREQLADGGRIVIPVGDRHLQKLYRYQRHGDDWQRTGGLGCVFVPLVGQFGW